MLTVYDEQFATPETNWFSMFADTAAELPAIDGLGDKLIAQGSDAYVISEGATYIMNSNGEWIVQGV